MNGALSWLLRELGFDITLHAAIVRRKSDTADPGVNHVTLFVHFDDGDVLADAGMGDGLLDPLPLEEGEYPQEPFVFALRRRGSEWTFVHDAAGSFASMDILGAPIEMSGVKDEHRFLSTSPNSAFVQALVLLRRRETGIDILRSRTLYRTGADGRSKHVLNGEAELREVFAEVFETSVTDEELDVLWQRACDQHEAFLASRR